MLISPDVKIWPVTPGLILNCISRSLQGYYILYTISNIMLDRYGLLNIFEVLLQSRVFEGTISHSQAKESPAASRGALWARVLIFACSNVQRLRLAICAMFSALCAVWCAVSSVCCAQCAVWCASTAGLRSPGLWGKYRSLSVRNAILLQRTLCKMKPNRNTIDSECLKCL